MQEDSAEELKEIETHKEDADIESNTINRISTEIAIETNNNQSEHDAAESNEIRNILNYTQSQYKQQDIETQREIYLTCIYIHKILSNKKVFKTVTDESIYGKQYMLDNVYVLTDGCSLYVSRKAVKYLQCTIDETEQVKKLWQQLRSITYEEIQYRSVQSIYAQMKRRYKELLKIENAESKKSLEDIIMKRNMSKTLQWQFSEYVDYDMAFSLERIINMYLIMTIDDTLESISVGLYNSIPILRMKTSTEEYYLLPKSNK
jgi:hypothetical protein